MKRLLFVAVLVCLTCAGYSQSCSPTTVITAQSRTGMKHRPPAAQTVSAHTTTVQDMLTQWPNPAHVNKQANTPIDPRENQVFTLKGDVWVAKIEANDCDIHLELAPPGQGPDAERVIVEIPQELAQVQSTMVQALSKNGNGDLNHKKSIKLTQSLPIEVTGLAFFDAFHFSNANPKKGHGHGSAAVGVLWELHPVFKVTILSGAPAGHRMTLVAEDDGDPGARSGGSPAVAQGTGGDEGNQDFAFAVSSSFLQSLESGHTILPTFNVTLGGHSKIHPLESDCEMHVAATLQSPQTFGFPEALVIEPPNLCEIDPNGDVSDEVDGWLSIFDDLLGKNCQASGFPRIFTEHATGGAGASNPDHVFELHPATSISCDGETHSFIKFVKIFPGMRAISPRTAASCIANRKLEVKFDSDHDRYLFRESGGTCGNFAKIAIESVMPGTVKAPGSGGGHSAIAHVSADGESSSTLKIYTLAGTDADDWLTGNPSPITLHGVITYDYFSLLKKIHPPKQDWQRFTDWTPIDFPLAFVAFGESADQPADQEQ